MSSLRSWAPPVPYIRCVDPVLFRIVAKIVTGVHEGDFIATVGRGALGQEDEPIDVWSGGSGHVGGRARRGQRPPSRAFVGVSVEIRAGSTLSYTLKQLRK